MSNEPSKLIRIIDGPRVYEEFKHRIEAGTETLLRSCLYEEVQPATDMLVHLNIMLASMTCIDGSIDAERVKGFVSDLNEWATRLAAHRNSLHPELLDNEQSRKRYQALRSMAEAARPSGEI
jgi:hypothetical protein